LIILFASALSQDFVVANKSFWRARGKIQRSFFKLSRENRRAWIKIPVIILCASTFSRDFLLGKIHSGACAQKIKRLLCKLSRENGGA